MAFNYVKPKLYFSKYKQICKIRLNIKFNKDIKINADYKYFE